MSATKLARERSTTYLINHLITRVTFIETPSKSLSCLICGTILKNPMQLSCGHRVCKGCCESPVLVNQEDGKKYCPEDGEDIERIFPDTSALKDIMYMDCYCVSKEEGCEWIGLLLDLEQHTGSCAYSIEAECPFSVFHCTFKGTPTKLQHHLQEQETEHECLLLTSLQQQMVGVKENNVLLETIRRNPKLVPVSFDDVVLQLNSLWKEINGRVADAANVKDNFSAVTAELVNRSTLSKQKLFTFFDNYINIVRNIEQQIQSVETGAQSEDGEDITATTAKAVDKVHRLETTGKTQNKHISELGIKIRIAQCSSRNGMYTWKLDKLRNRLSEAEKGNNRELFTPPLFTSDFGYKYSIKVILPDRSKISSRGDVPYMGIYFVLMQGDYDEILRFPFPYPVDFTLINFGKQPPITRTLYPDPEKAHFDKPGKNMNPAIGFAKFCPVSALRSETGFVKDDTIYFKIVVKKDGIDVNEPDV